jgi:anti-sigma-K factor RskA
MNDAMTCEDANWLLAAYVTDSLADEERYAFAAHLVECRLHDPELNGYRTVASRLPSVINPVQAPSQLRSSLLSSFDVLVNAPRTQEAPQTVAVAAPGRSSLFGWLRAPGFAYGLAAALAVAVIALAGLAVTRGSGGENIRRVTNEADGGQLDLTYLPDNKLGVFDLNLPALASNRVYQAWQITDAGPVSLGLVAGQGATAFNADLSRATNIAITVEPAGGSPQPTTAPILVTKFKS